MRTSVQPEMHVESYVSLFHQVPLLTLMPTLAVAVDPTILTMYIAVEVRPPCSAVTGMQELEYTTAGQERKQE